MTRLIEFLIALALVLALFLVIGLVLPSKRHLEESAETNRRMTIVFDTLNNVRRLKDWNPLLPSATSALSYSGGGETNEGVGARVDYDVPGQWGKGSWEITASERPAPNGGTGNITYAITDQKFGTGKQTSFALAPTGKNNRNVKVTQSYDVTYGWNLVGRYAGMYVSRHVGDAVKSGLSKLTNLLATVPNVDYRVENNPLVDMKIVDVPAEDLLIVRAGNIDRSNAAIAASIKSNQEWIKRVMEANGLEAAGPVRIITTDYGAEKYAFDVAQPVRKSGSAPKNAEGQTPPVALPADTAAASTDGLKVTISGDAPVKYEHTKPHRAASAHYSGFLGELDTARNGLRAWAVTYGHEVVDRPYESWKSGVDASTSIDTSGPKGEFDIYWAIK